MKNKYILALAFLIFGLPVFSNDINPISQYYSTLEEVMNMTGNYSWTVRESQVLLKGLEGEELETALEQWNYSTNVQKANKITITGKPSASYESIYFKPCQSLVMKKIEGTTNSYTDLFRMNGVVIGTYYDEKENIKPQIFNTNNVTFTSFINAITNKGGNITLSDTNFIKNKSATDGGAIYNESGTVNVNQGSNLYYNLATDKGGAIYNSKNGILNIQKSTVGGQHNEGIYYIMGNSDVSSGYHIMNNGSVKLDSETTVTAENTMPNSDVIYNIDGYLGSDDWIIIYYIVPEWKDVRNRNWTEEDIKRFDSSKWVHIYPLGNEATYGAGIYNEGNATINSTTFRYNVAKKNEDNAGGYGGGIYNKGYLSVTSSTFYYNKAVKGGGIYNATSEDKNILIQKTSFSSNQATDGAGAYVESGNVTFKNDTFGEWGTIPSNKATSGGAIYNDENGKVNIISSTFVNNKAEQGGDIYNKGQLSISKSTFGYTPKPKNNYIIVPFYTFRNPTEVTIDGTTSVVRPIYYEPIRWTAFEYNTGSSATQGGAIYNAGTIVDITSTNFNKGTAVEGGAIYNAGTINKILKSKFNGNYTAYTKNNEDDEDRDALGGAIFNEELIYVENSTFKDNYAKDGKGGAIYNAEDTAKFNKSTFDGNYANSGGAIYVHKGTVNDNTSTLKNNHAQEGGAIYNAENGIVTLEKTKLFLNSAYKTTDTKDDDGNIINTEDVLTDGGAIYNKGTLNLNTVTFGDKKKKYKYSNKASNGSAIYNTNIVNSLLSTIMYHEGTNGTIYNSGTFNSERDTFNNNKSATGGVFYGTKESKTVIEGSTFTSNSAVNGGAIYSEGELKIDDKEYTVIKKKKEKTVVSQIKFSKNIVTDNGGAIYLSNTATGEIKNADFLSNKAYKETTETKNVDAKTTKDKDGNVVVTEPAKTVVTITPSGSGGAIYIGSALTGGTDSASTETTGNTKITNSNFNSNNVGLNGGAIYVDKNSVVDIENSTFEKNSAYSIITKKTTTQQGKKKKTTTTKSAQGEGGAIYVSGNSDVNIKNTTFKKNKSTMGGALYVTAYEKPKTETTDNNSTEDNNDTTGTNDESGSGTTDTEPEPEPEPNHITVKDSNFTGNISYGYGGAILNAGYLDIENTDFNGNEAQYGGAVANMGAGTLTVDNATFDKNKAGAGGAIYNTGNATVKNSTFNNTKKYASSAGGAIFNQGGTLTLENNKFDKSIGQMGGALYNTYGSYGFYQIPGTINSTSNKYLSSIAYQGGALLNVSGTFNSKNDEFTNNNATFGGAIYTTGTIKSENSTFDGNVSAYGGAIYNTSKLTITGGEFKNNQGSVGGAIYSFANNSSDKEGKVIYNAVITIDNVNFSKNNGLTYAGAIFTSGTDLTVNNSTFDGNTTNMVGGAILIQDTQSTDDKGVVTHRTNKAKITGSTFKNNSAKSNGGAIFTETSGTIRLNTDEKTETEETDSTTTDNNTTDGNNTNNSENETTSDGNTDTDNNTETETQSGDSTTEEPVVYAPIVFENNSAESGGAIYNYQGTILADKVEFKNNSATKYGGAVLNNYLFQIGETVTSIDDNTYNEELQTSLFETNSAKYGGAIFNVNAIYLNGVHFKGNTASENGGAIYNEHSTIVINTLFENNSATENGGAIYSIKNYSTKDYKIVDSYIYASKFKNNSGKLGGAVYTGNYASLTVALSEFSENKAKTNGGAIYHSPNTTSGAPLKINASTFTGNEAQKGSGGAIYTTSEAVVNIKNSLFENNKATGGSGGAIYLGTHSNATLTNNFFKNNTATENGGALYISTTSNRVEITNSGSGFDGNSAKKGGAVYVAKDTKNVIFNDVQFVNNTATEAGGAIYIDKNSVVEVVSRESDVLFRGNTANKKSNAIYLNDAGLILNTIDKDVHTITIDDEIAGKGTITIKGDATLGEKLKITDGSNIEFITDSNSTTNVANENSLSAASYVLGNNSTLNIANNKIGTVKLKSLSVENSAISNFAIDMDLKNGESDKVTAETVEGTGAINVSKVNLTSDSKTPVTINVGEGSLVDTMSVTSAETKEATYKLKSSLDENGILRATAYRQKAKPCTLAAPVAAQLGGYLTQINSYDQAFMNMDLNMTKTLDERTAEMNIRTASLSSMENGKWKMENDADVKLAYSPQFDNGMNRNGKGLWTRPYVTFERVNLSHGPKVGSISYGNFFGGDADIKHLNNGWKRQFSAYVGYNGSTLDFNKQSIDQNGGTIGVTEVWYKNNFFTGLTANVSANAVNASTDLGHENFPMLMAGVASKTGYNFEFKKGKFILQPSLLLSYSFVHTFAHNNGLGHRVSSSPLHAIQVAPGVKFIFNLPKGWQPYLAVNMRWNIIDKTHFSLPDVSIPDMSINPYVEYGVGIQRKWGERFTGFGQALIRNGGRNGVMLSFGLKWAIGK